MSAVTTRPSNQVRTLSDSVDQYPYVWLMCREAPDPKPFTRIVHSDRPVVGWEKADAIATLQKYDGTSFRDWRILAVFVQGKLIDGQADPEGRWRFHDVEHR
jgi:hypothetical protein